MELSLYHDPTLKKLIKRERDPPVDHP